MLSSLTRTAGIAGSAMVTAIAGGAVAMGWKYWQVTKSATAAAADAPNNVTPEVPIGIETLESLLSSIKEAPSSAVGEINIKAATLMGEVAAANVTAPPAVRLAAVAAAGAEAGLNEPTARVGAIAACEAAAKRYSELKAVTPVTIITCATIGALAAYYVIKNFDGLKTEIANNNANIVNLEAEIANNNANIVNLEADIANSNANIVNLEAEIANNNANIVNLETEIANNNANNAARFANIERILNARAQTFIHNLDSMTHGALVDLLTCPISLDIIADPIYMNDNRFYERAAITEYFAGNRMVSPINPSITLEDPRNVPTHQQAKNFLQRNRERLLSNPSPEITALEKELETLRRSSSAARQIGFMSGQGTTQQLPIDNDLELRMSM